MDHEMYPDLLSVRRILVIKLRHLGDVLLTSPLFFSLKRAMPEAKIDAYLYEEAIPMLQGHPAIESFFGYDKRWKNHSFLFRLRKELELLIRLRKQRYDLVMNLTEGDRGAIVSKFSKASICVGIDPQGSGMRGKKKVYTHIVKQYGAPRHIVEKNLDAIRRIGISPLEQEKELFFHIPSQAISSVEQLLSSYGITENPYVLIHPTSRWKFKCWPKEYWKELIKKIISRGLKVVVCSGPEEEEIQIVREICLPFDAQYCVNLSGKIDIKEFGALVHKSHLLICVDSVAHHIANALKARVLVLFGPTCSIRWGPWQNTNARVLQQNFSCCPCSLDGCGGSKISDCLQTLSVETVFREIETMI